ncbi:MAG: hypothetical protein QM765_44715 [Myxococcales bacterium]
MGGIIRILHRSCTAAAFDGSQAGAAVIESAGEDHADCSRAGGDGGGAKERVDRGAGAVLVRPASQGDVVVLDHHVMVRRGEIDRAGLDGLALVGQAGLQEAVAADHLVDLGAMEGGEVKDDEDGGGEVQGELTGEGCQRFDASGRGAHYDEIASGHFADSLFTAETLRTRRTT